MCICLILMRKQLLMFWSHRYQLAHQCGGPITTIMVLMTDATCLIVAGFETGLNQFCLGLSYVPSLLFEEKSSCMISRKFWCCCWRRKKGGGWCDKQKSGRAMGVAKTFSKIFKFQQAISFWLGHTYVFFRFWFPDGLYQDMFLPTFYYTWPKGVMILCCNCIVSVPVFAL